MEIRMAIREIEEIRRKERERQKGWERELQEEFDADSKDVLAFTLAAWQLFIPLVVALFITGLIVMFLLNLF
jgi:hypothetical protein